jgi:hypothetical protein
LAGSAASRKPATGPSVSVPVSVIAIDGSSSLPAALTLFATGASFVGSTTIVAVAGAASAPDASRASNWKPVEPFQFVAGTK